jgi:hypothetical protein
MDLFRYLHVSIFTEMDKEVIKSKITGILKSSAFRRTLISIVIGGLSGFLYFYFVGCKSGTCPITSNPYGSIITGGLLGFLIGGSSASDKAKENTSNQ